MADSHKSTNRVLMGDMPLVLQALSVACAAEDVLGPNIVDRDAITRLIERIVADDAAAQFLLQTTRERIEAAVEETAGEAP